MGCIAAQWVNYEIDFTYISNNMKLASTEVGRMDLVGSWILIDLIILHIIISLLSMAS
jgi:hypothetical protein